MTVSAGAGGGTVVGVVLGGGAAGGGSSTVGQVLGQLPHTGASHIMLTLAIALFLVVTGVLVTGMGRHRPVLAPVAGTAVGAPGDDGTQA